MAGDGWRQFTRETLSADVVQRYLMDQAVLQFASASERTAELTTPQAGMLSYLRDEDRYEGRTPSAAGALTGGAWRGFGRSWGVIDAAPPAPVVGNLATPQTGDGAYIGPWRCNARVVGRTAPAWRQTEPAQVGSIAGRNTLLADAATAGAPLHAGFLCYVTGKDRLYAVNADQTWRLIGGRAGAAVSLTTGTGQPQTGWTGGGYTGTLQHHGNGMATVYVEVTRSGADLAVSTLGSVINSPVLLLPAGWEARAATVLSSGATGRGAHGHMSAATRTLTLTAVTGTADVTTGSTISLGATYALAAPQDLDD